MTFQQRYAALEDKFKAQIEKDNEYFEWKGKQRSYYLPNIEPDGKVEFVLVAMEPSGFADESDPSLCRDKPVCPRNFSCSVEDFILHFCIREYLCADGQTYHITDIAKGGMSTQQARGSSGERWERWYPWLCQELKLVAKPGALVIAVGKGVGDFLKGRRTPNFRGSLLHFSNNANIARTIAPQLLCEQYREFSTNLRWDDVVHNARDVMKGEEFNKWRSRTLQRLKRGETESRKMLMFTYKCQFAAILGKPLA